MASPRVSGPRPDQILHQAAEPAFWLSRDLRLAWVNRAWEELTGRPSAEVIGLPCLAHGPTRADDLGGVGASFYPPAESLGGRPTATRTLIVHASGERRWRRVDYWPFHNEKGELTALLGLVRAPEEPGILPDSESQRLRTELMEVRHRLVSRREPEALVGRGPSHRRVLRQVAAAAASEVPVLIVGETGTGKRHVARTIHQSGLRRQGPLLPIDVEALPPDVLERELFVSKPSAAGEAAAEGHGPGGLALPEGSTLLIGDIIELPRDLQARLVEGLDGPARVIATSTVDPRSALASERLRTDFYCAFTALVIRLDPLRERLDELPLLAQHFLERANRRGGRQRGGLSPEALRVLLAYDWPGNLRELGRVIDEAQGNGDGELIAAADLPATIRGHLASAYTPPAQPPTITPLDEILTDVERRLIENALVRARRNKSRAAELLGISRPRLYRRIKELGLPEDPEPADDSAIATDGQP